MPGSLTVVGTGIRAGIQLTEEARDALVRADRVFFLAEPIGAGVIQMLWPDARPLHDLYQEGVVRQHAYEVMVETILAPVRAGLSVCAAFYGHAGIFGTPGHEAVKRARSEGYEAVMLPGISAMDCLFADLGIDPGRRGCLNYEATDFLARRPPVDTSAVLVLWQVTVIGRSDAVTEPDLSQLPLLVDLLVELYSPEQEIIVYEASPNPIGRADVCRVPLRELGHIELPQMATLVVYPAEAVAEAFASAARTEAAATVLPLDP